MHFGLLDADEILYVDKVESPQSVRMVSTIGTRNPLYCTAMGKAILAFLPPGKRNLLLEAIDLTMRTPHTLTEKVTLLKHLAIVRSVGYAIDDEENEEGIRCVAAPIFDRIGTPFGAISLAGPAYRLPVRRLQELSIHVVKAAETVSRHHS